jgi:hypothetical protein
VDLEFRSIQLFDETDVQYSSFERIFGNRDDEEVDMLNVCSVSGRLENFLLHELAVCPGKRTRDAIV